MTDNPALMADTDRPENLHIFRGFSMTITKRLFVIFILLALSLIALSAYSLSALSGFQSRFEFVQVNAIPVSYTHLTLPTTERV